jgi:hypothetical protein
VIKKFPNCIFRSNGRESEKEERERDLLKNFTTKAPTYNPAPTVLFATQ